MVEYNGQGSPVVSLLMVAGALLTMGRGLAYLVDEGLGRQDPALLDRAVVGTAAIALLLAAGSYLRTTLVNQIGERVLADIRQALFAHLLTLSPGWYESARTGDVLARLTTDTAIVQTVMTSTVSMASSPSSSPPPPPPPLSSLLAFFAALRSALAVASSGSRSFFSFFSFFEDLGFLSEPEWSSARRFSPILSRAGCECEI